MDPKSRWEQERLEGKQQRLSSIIASAERVFLRKGLEKATMQDVAKEDNVGIATLFRYFPKKDKLIVAVATKLMESQAPVFEEIAQRQESCLSKLERVFDYFVSFSRESREERTKLLEAFQSYAAQSPEPLEDIDKYNAVYHRISAIYRRIIEEGIRDGSIRSDIPIQETLSTMANAFGIFAQKLSLQKNIVMLESDMDAETQLLLMKSIFLEYLRGPRGSGAASDA
ncbi:TetR/AcrR family transcriptional regulator [Paenibacillus doosanensis]|uniref:TetR/AcrR family transcriptional regulator n=1 Tax=Paenibacillus doosanensis TaxID=1229154 RepID=UPI00217FE5E0|nr:TetR/AcrR family transcriptional regulator [Paenibacillus doosanensis]MCS7459598.1 TetR/AcrR family transcriptional regulator [Paenibacillus doosanensis]